MARSRSLSLTLLVVASLAACSDDSTKHLADAPAGGSGGDGSLAPQVNPGIYITDATSKISVFDLAATGDVAPTRTIAGPTTQLATAIGIVVDRAGDIYVANRSGSAVTVYAPDATGDAAPLRSLTTTGMQSPETLAIDPAGNVFAASCPNCGTSAGGDIGIYHFPAGSTTSDYAIAGSATTLTNPAVTLDPAGHIVVSNSFGGDVAIYPGTASGDAAPTSSFVPDNSNVQSLVAGDGVIALGAPGAGIQLYNPAATGTAEPVSTIVATADFPLVYPGGLFLDSSVSPPLLYVADFSANALYIITTTGSGTALAIDTVRTISGSDTGLDQPLDITVVH